MIFFSILICLFIFLFSVNQVEAAFVEQMAIAPKSIAMGNAVTAYPPGHYAVHYNPAGLSLLPDGKYITQGGLVAHVDKTSRFIRNEYFDGFLAGQFDQDPLIDRNKKYHEGTTTRSKMYLPVVDTTIDFLGAPLFGLSYRKPGSKWTFGISNYAPIAGGFVHGAEGDPTRFNGREVYMQHLIYIAPAVSYEVSDDLSFGVTVGAGQTSLGVEMANRSPGDIIALTRTLGNATEDLEIPVISELTFPPPWFGGGISPYDKLADISLSMRDDFSPNYNLGVLWDAFDWLTLGAVYQSSIEAQLRGRYEFDYTDTFRQVVNWQGSSPLLLQISGMLKLPTNPVDSQTGRVTGEMEFPERVQAGFKLHPFDWLKCTFDLKWANWSVIQEDNFRLDQDIQLLEMAKMTGYTGGPKNLVIERNFSDTFDWGAGIEIKPLDWLAIRGGYEWRKSPVPSEYFDTLTGFMPDMHSFGAGIGLYLPHNIKSNLSVGYAVNKGFRIPSGHSVNFNSEEVTDVLAPYTGLDYEQDLQIYTMAFDIQMPFETFTHMLHKQNQMVHHSLSKLNPFSGHGETGDHELPEGEGELKSYSEEALQVEVPETPVEKKLYRERPVPGKELQREVRKMLKDWKNAWEKADLEDYSRFYHPNATQYNKVGRLDILKKVYNEWQMEEPESINLDRIQVYKHPEGVEATFIQEYQGSKGYYDKGITSLLITRYEDRWVIKKEKWSSIEKTKKKIPDRGVVDWVKNLQKLWNNKEYTEFKNQYKPPAKFFLRERLQGPLKRRYSLTTKKEIFARRHILDFKMRDWKEANAKELKIEDVKVYRHSKGRKVEFGQKYQTKAGDEVRNMNVELILEKQGDTWNIVEEEWVPVGTQ